MYVPIKYINSQYVQFAKYTLQNIIQFNIETVCWTERKYSIKSFRDISWDIHMSIISQNEIHPYLRNVPAVCPLFQ